MTSIMIKTLLSLLLVNNVYGQAKEIPVTERTASTYPQIQQQTQYFGSQPGLRTAASASETQEGEKIQQDESLKNSNDEQQNLLNFIQQQGLLRQQNPFLYQYQQQQQQQLQQQLDQQQLQQQQLQQLFQPQPQYQQQVGLQQTRQNYQLQALLQRQRLQEQLLQQQLLQQKNIGLQQQQQQQQQQPQRQQQPQTQQQLQSQPQQFPQNNLLGVAFSPATSVAKTRFTGNGINYSF